ncbi:hypothetical protein HDU85_006537, partial [Gaertneriomyces sp. JEL0708]
ERLQIAYQFGRALRTIHSWEPTGVAVLGVPADSGVATNSCPREWLRATLNFFDENMMRDLGQTRRGEGVKSMSIMRDIFNQMGENNSKLVFLHGDAVLANVLFAQDQESENWRAVGAVDWGCAGFGDHRFDLGTAAWSIAAAAALVDEAELTEQYVGSLLEGYGGVEGDFETLRKWVHLYHLQSLVVHLD